MPTPRSLAAAAVIKDRIYVVGGYDEGREFATCESYRPASDAWQSCAPMLLPRGSPGLAQVGANLFAVGGGWSGFVGFNERYNPVDDRWTSFETPLVGDWRSLAVASLPGEFYALGGYSNGRRLPFNYVYEVFTNRTFLPAFQAGDQQP
jgi:N-acetylneuraminic acid mutarotase